jgi:hypothetical protein
MIRAEVHPWEFVPTEPSMSSMFEETRLNYFSFESEKRKSNLK